MVIRVPEHIKMEDLIEQLKEFNIYKQMILAGETNGRNIIVETKDGTCRILHQKIKDQPKGRKAKISHIPGLAANIDEIERITVFVDGKEFEFVACQ
jgi:hypothetical protein